MPSVTAEMLFRSQQFQILQLFVKDESGCLTPAYAYAWAEEVYPLFDDGAVWHKPYGDQFKVSEKQMSEVSKLLDEKWISKQPITFYELEDHYEARSGRQGWDRSSLIRACRYMRIHGLFDDTFWDALLQNGQCPTEAHSITREFNADDVYFM